MSKYDEYNNADGDNPTFRRDFQGPVGDVVVEIETDAGITGVGHANWGTGAIATIVEETLSKIVLGRDPRDHEKLWDMMYRTTLPFGRKGAAIEAISGVGDHALTSPNSLDDSATGFSTGEREVVATNAASANRTFQKFRET